jgi:hypothetical protein
MKKENYKLDKTNDNHKIVLEINKNSLEFSRSIDRKNCWKAKS